MPYRDQWRNYSFEWFLQVAKQYGFKTWILGWWWENYPESLRLVNGIDTTIPEYYAYKCAKLWLDFGKTVESLDPPFTKFVRNVVNFHRAIMRYMKH